MYTISSASRCVVSSGIASPFGFLINDKPVKGGQDVLAEYLIDAKRVFQAECDALFSMDRMFTENDSDKLSAMLKLLVEARKTWQEEATDNAR